MTNKHDHFEDLIVELLLKGRTHAAIVRLLMQEHGLKTTTSEFYKWHRARTARHLKNQIIAKPVLQPAAAPVATAAQAPAPSKAIKPAPTPTASKQDPDPLSFLMKGKGKFDFLIPTEEELKIEQQEAGKIRFGKK